MQSGLYVTLSAAVAVDRRMTTIAANIANQSTPGYRAEEVSFKSLVSKAGANPVHFASQGELFISRRQGVPMKTDNPLDVAVQGKGWLALQTPDGTVYTKDGRMRMDESGALVSVDGYPVLDAGNARHSARSERRSSNHRARRNDFAKGSPDRGHRRLHA